MVVSQKYGNQSIARPSYTTLGNKPKESSIITQGHLLDYVHSRIIHNSQKLDISQGIDKENVVFIHRSITQLLKTMPS